MEQREICAEEQAVKEALAEDTRFRFYKGMEIAVRPETRGISKEVFQIYRINGRFDLADAYILHAVYMLCHATPDMIMQWLKLERRHYPKKAVPNINPELLMKKVKILAHNGLLMLSDYITKDKREVVEICTCSLFGHTYFKNVLDTPYLPYDEDSFFHAEVECFKRMSAAVVTLALASEDSCEKCGISGRILYGKRFNAEAFTYGYACMDFDEEKRIYIVEPVYFHVNSDVMSEEESLGRVEERLRKVEKLVANIAKKEETAVIPVFCVENTGGLKQLTSIAKKRIGTDMYQHALYTSENLISAFGGSLDNSFVSVQFSRAEKPENRKVRVNLAGNAWREFL